MGQHGESVLDVVEHVEHQVVGGEGGADQGGGFRRLEQHVELAPAGHELVEVRRQQRAGRVGPAIDFPRFAQRQAQPLALHGLLRRVRRVHLGQAAVFAAQVDLVVVEGDVAADELALETRGVVATGRDVHVVGLALVDHLGRFHRRAALPFLDDARVAGFGQRALAEVGVDEHGVAVDPLQAALGLGAEEAVFHPRLVVQVELAGDVGVGAAARERDQAAVVVRAQAVRAVPDPVLVLFGVERVQVQQQLPLRSVLAVLLQRGAAPDAALVVLVAPEVVVVVAHLADAGDALVGVVDVQQLGLERAEFIGVGQLGLGDGVLLAHPGQRLVAGHFLQPLVWIGCHRGTSVLGLGRAAGQADGDRGGKAETGNRGHAGGSGQVIKPETLAQPPCARTCLKLAAQAAEATARRRGDAGRGAIRRRAWTGRARLLAAAGLAGAAACGTR